MDRNDQNERLSTEARPSDRRVSPRFGIPRCNVYSAGQRMHLINLGRQGMAIESFGRCTFSRSEEHSFVLDDEINSVEVLGSISWVSSSWIKESNVPGTGLVQKVGVSFRDVVSPFRVGLWRSIESWQADASDPDFGFLPAAELPANQLRPVVTMETPRDGAVTSSRFVTIEGTLSDPGTVSEIKINGTRASVEGNRFSTRIHLTKPVNYLCAVVAHWNGRYSTAFLGKIKRESTDDSFVEGGEGPSDLHSRLSEIADDLLQDH